MWFNVSLFSLSKKNIAYCETGTSIVFLKNHSICSLCYLYETNLGIYIYIYVCVCVHDYSDVLYIYKMCMEYNAVASVNIDL